MSMSLLDQYGQQKIGEHHCNGRREDIAPKAFTALVLILDIHKPFASNGRTYCDSCAPTMYPCPTVKAVYEALED